MINFLYRDESYLDLTLFASVTRVLKSSRLRFLFWLLFLFSAFHYQLNINFRLSFFVFDILDHEQPSESVTPEQAEHVEPSLAADTSTGTLVCVCVCVCVCFFYLLIDFGMFFWIKKMDNGRFVKMDNVRFV